MAQNATLQVVIALKDQASAGLAAFGKNAQNIEKAALVSTTALTAFSLAIGGIVNEAGKLEQTKVAFTTLLGSGVAATKMIRELSQFAATTPFEMPGITNMAQRFLAAGYSAEEIIPKLKAVGDAASAMGVGQAGADQITLALTQMSSRATMSGQEIMQLAQVGINGFGLLSEQTGIAESKLRDMSEKGLIPGKQAADLLAQAMQQKFSGAMEAQSETLIGLISTLRDTFRLTAQTIGGEFLNSAKDLVRGAISAVVTVGEWITKHRELVTQIVKTAAVLLTLGTVIFGTITVISKTVEMVTILSKALFLGNLQFLAVIGVVAAATFALIKLSDTFGGIGNAFKALGNAFVIIGNAILQVFQQLGNGILKTFDDTLKKIGAGLNTVIGFANKLGANFSTVNLGVNFRLNEQATIGRINALYGTLDQMQADAILKKGDAAQAAAKAQQEVSKALKLSNAELEKNKDALLGAGTASKETAKEAEKLADSVGDLQKEYKDLANKGGDALAELEDDHNQKMSSIRDDINKTLESLTKLSQEYEKERKSDVKSVAEEVVATEKRIADIKKELSGDVSESRRKELQNELAKEQNAYAQSASFIQSIDGQVVEARRVAGLTDLQRAIEEYNQKRLLAEQEFVQKQNQLNRELEITRQKEFAEISLYQLKKEKITDLMFQAFVSFQLMQEEQFRFSKEKIEAEIDLYRQLGEAISKVRGGSAGQVNRVAVNDAIIAPDGKIISTHPDDYLIATKNPQSLVGGGGVSSIVVNVYGDVSGNEIVETVKKAIMKDLKFNTQI